jgi:hypothetical protein
LFDHRTRPANASTADDFAALPDVIAVLRSGVDTRRMM